ncbi:MAG: phosphatidate cytidylyltransferase [Magnetococcus sp. WYHC-3]
MGRLNLKSLQTRTLAAAVIAPLFLAIVWQGGWIFKLTIFAAFIVAVCEWYGLATKIKSKWAYLIGGFLYIAFGFVSFVMLGTGYKELAILFVLIIWFSDTGAYFFGKFIGGPKMAPVISPNKTWAGMGGATLCPVLFTAAFVYVWPPGQPFWQLVLMAAITGGAGQLGDLLISVAKRKAGVKDTGRLIPGHGGLLDRIDAMILGSIVFYAAVQGF